MSGCFSAPFSRTVTGRERAANGPNERRGSIHCSIFAGSIFSFVSRSPHRSFDVRNCWRTKQVPACLEESLRLAHCCVSGCWLSNLTPFWKKRGCVANMPKHTQRMLDVFQEFARRFNGFSPAAHDYLQQRLALTEKSFRWDSHPIMRDRLAAVSRYPASELADGRSAAELIPDLDARGSNDSMASSNSVN